MDVDFGSVVARRGEPGAVGRDSLFNYESREWREWGGESSGKSRLWLPFSIRDIRVIRSAGCSVLLLPICVHPRPFAVETGRKSEKCRFGGRKSRFFIENGPKRPENGVFRRFLTIFHLRGPLRLVSVDDFLSEA